MANMRPSDRAAALRLNSNAGNLNTRNSVFDDAPTPWHAVKAYTEITAILDAKGRTLFLCRHELAGRIIGAVNMVDCAYRKEMP